MPRSVLIVKLAAIGDVVMALPMISALRAQDPATHITWLCGMTVKPLLDCVEGIDELVAVDDVAVLAGNAARKAQAVVGGWSALGKRRFDLVLTAHSDPRYRMLAARVRAAERRWLGEREPRPRLVPGRFHGDEYVRLVTEVDDGTAKHYAVPPLRLALDRGVGERLATLGAARKIALAPGGARNPARDNPLRRWPLEGYVSLARDLAANGDIVLLTGSGDDAWVRAAFTGIDVVDLVGETTLPGLAALFARCAAVVTHDSGPLHIARLVDAPTVGLFGPTAPATVVRSAAHLITLWPGVALPCAPCYDGREFAPCASNLCLQLIAPADVVRAIDSLTAR